MKNLTGQKFGRLTALSTTGRKNGTNIIWLCQCDCGGTVEADSGNLHSGGVKSCGCLRVDENKCRAKHGKCGTREYRSWSSMLQRCENPSHHAYKYYGGRGISVCGRWHTFENFYADMGERPAGMSIGRIDNDGDYCPENCKWSTAAEQNNNQRRPRKVLV